MYDDDHLPIYIYTFWVCEPSNQWEIAFKCKHNDNLTYCTRVVYFDYYLLLLLLHDLMLYLSDQGYTRTRTRTPLQCEWNIIPNHSRVCLEFFFFFLAQQISVRTVDTVHE